MRMRHRCAAVRILGDRAERGRGAIRSMPHTGSLGVPRSPHAASDNSCLRLSDRFDALSVLDGVLLYRCERYGLNDTPMLVRADQLWTLG